MTLALALALSGCGAAHDPDVDHGSPYDDSRVHELSLTMAPAHWDAILHTPELEIYYPARFGFDGQVVENVGVRAGGESSRFAGNGKMQLRVKFDVFEAGQRFHGIERVNLSGMYDDPSLMRERLGYFVYRAQVPAPRSSGVRLVVNGEYRGLYDFEEVWDGRSVDDWFDEPIGPLYRIRKIGSDYDPYAFRGVEMNHYVPMPWEPRNNRPPEDHAVVAARLALLDELDPPSLEKVFDVDALIAYLAAATLMANTGYLAGDSVDDHLQYLDSATDRFHVLPWDPDQSFGRDNDPPDRSIFLNFHRSLVTRIIRDDPDYRARYQAEIEHLMQALPLDALDAEMDRIYEQIREHVYEDPNKIYPNDQFDWNLTYMKDFMAARYDSLRLQLAAP